MNSKTVLSKIMTLLSIDKEVELTFAKLKDGTIVESPTFDVGEELSVVSEDGKKTPAPDGEHELSLKDSEGKETLMKVITKDGKIVERENVELAAEDEETVKVEDIPQASGDAEKANEVKEQTGSVTSGTLEMEEETEEVETIPEDDDKKEKTIEIELGKKMEELAYRIEEMEKKMEEMAKHKMKDEDEEEEEDMELPKLDGAPVEEGMKFASVTNRNNYGKRVQDLQSNFLSKLYK